MKKKILFGILYGLAAGVIDVTPMILQNLTWDANISAFSMWIVIGFFLAVSEIKIHSILKGILFSFLALLPCAIIIGWKEPESLIPISIMTIILGGLLGFAIGKIKGKKE
jgi:hypothetical protein